MSAPIKLSELAVGASAVVQGYPKSGTAFIRLREMGLLAGTTLTLVRTAPLGDPLEIKLRGYHLTLRKSEAEHVLVEPV
ncbi:MAG: ferrous iron transport protein A [Opitutaceae bacterium]|nr:ferrous iron transport protein A [Opitutaceae bacterium]MBP9913453.1 ferrous iron transport protein A [Opitutaceae bacterium]